MINEDTTIVAALKAIADRNEGEITPEEVVAEAEFLPDDHPLHRAFPWDDRLAAHAHRLNVARALLHKHRPQYIITSTTRVTQMIRAPLYVRHPDAVPWEQRYIAVSRLRQPDMEEQARSAILAAYKRAAQVLAGARTLAVALECEEIIDADVKRLRDSFDKFTDDHPPPA